MGFIFILLANSLVPVCHALVMKISHINGHINNSFSFDGQQQTFPKLLQQNNYQTAMIGKWHLISDPVGFDFWQILPGQGAYYNPQMIRNGEKMVVEGLCCQLQLSPGD